MTRSILTLSIVALLIATLLLVVACGEEEEPAPAPAPAAPAPAVAPTTAPAPAPAPAATTAPAPAPAAAPTTAPAPAAPTAIPVPVAVAAEDAPDPKNPLGTIQYAQSNLGCNPGAGTVFCSQYQAVAWGVGEDLFTWRWRDDGTVEYAAGQLATGWDLASDGLSVTVDIRQGVEFHKDWGIMTAEDVAWSYNQVNPLITTHSIAPSASYFSTLFGENLAVASGNQVEYTFAAVDSHWHTYMMNGNGFVGMVVHPQRAQEENGEDWMRENFVGTGPFQVDEWIRDDRAVFTKSGIHWEFDPAVEKVVVLAMPEDATRVAALKTGELDVAALAIKSVPEVLDAGFISTGSGNASQQGVIFSGNLWETHNALTGEDLNTPANGVYARDIQWIGNPYRPNDGNNPDDLACPDGADSDSDGPELRRHGAGETGALGSGDGDRQGYDQRAFAQRLGLAGSRRLRRREERVLGHQVGVPHTTRRWPRSTWTRLDTPGAATEPGSRCRCSSRRVIAEVSVRRSATRSVA